MLSASSQETMGSRADCCVRVCVCVRVGIRCVCAHMCVYLLCVCVCVRCVCVRVYVVCVCARVRVCAPLLCDLCTTGTIAWLGLARTMWGWTINIRCIYGVFGREITRHTVIYGVYIRFWPTLQVTSPEFSLLSTSRTMDTTSLFLCHAHLCCQQQMSMVPWKQNLSQFMPRTPLLNMVPWKQILSPLMPRTRKEAWSRSPFLCCPQKCTFCGVTFFLGCICTAVALKRLARSARIKRFDGK